VWQRTVERCPLERGSQRRREGVAGRGVDGHVDPLVEAVVGRHVVGHERSRGQHRLANEGGRLAGGVDAAVVDGEVVAEAGEQGLERRGQARWGREVAHTCVSGFEHPVGSDVDQRVPGREQDRSVLAGDVGIGG
jgi:hypothetical protein